MKNTFINAKPGDKVFSLKYGAGRVEVNYGLPGILMLHVIFGDGFGGHETAGYTISGRFNEEDRTPDLYWKKPVITRKQRINQIKMKAFRHGVEYGKLIRKNIPSLAESIDFSNLDDAGLNRFYDISVAFMKEIREIRKDG